MEPPATDPTKVKSIYHLVLIALMLLVFVQLGIVSRKRSLPPLAGPMVGDTLPSVLVQRLNGGGAEMIGEILRKAGSCGVVFAVDPYCSVCSRMRYTWRGVFQAWVDSVGLELPVLWVGGEDVLEMRAFVEGFDLPGVTVVRIQRDFGVAWRRLGVYGTPISYLVDRGGIVRAGVAGPLLPPAELTRTFCLER
jgi:hypothetical protein